MYLPLVVGELKSKTILYTRPTPCPIGIGSVLSNVGNVYPQSSLLSGDQSESCTAFSCASYADEGHVCRLMESIFASSVETQPANGTKFAADTLLKATSSIRCLLPSHDKIQIISSIKSGTRSFEDN